MAEQTKETIRQILDHFAKYINYDPAQKRFNLLSDNYTFYQAGKKMEMLISDYDQSGVLAAMYAKHTFLDVLKCKRMLLSDLIPALATENSQVMTDLQTTVDMYKDFESEGYKDAISSYMEDMNNLTMQVCKLSMIGERDPQTEESEFVNAVISAVNDLNKLRMDLYQKSDRPVAKIEKFTTRVLVFNRMADCILQLEQMPDAIYFCYIRQDDTANGYFAFMFKSNGNLFSVNDRVPEAYIGQHDHGRNGRWAEAHAGSMFPYDFIFSYSEHDYKGYASKYFIDDEQLEFSKMDPKAYSPILISMIILRNKFADKIIDQEPVYLTSLFHEDYKKEHPGTELAVLESSAIALRHSEYRCGIDPNKVVSDEYNKKFDIRTPGGFWTSLYGEGFKPDFTGLLSTARPYKQLEQWEIDNGKEQPKQTFHAEFVGTQKQMDMEVYRKIRIQLANYIKKQMEQELELWNISNLYGYVNERLKKSKDKFLDLVFRKQFISMHPECKHVFDTSDHDQTNKESTAQDPLIAFRPKFTEQKLMGQVQICTDKIYPHGGDTVLNTSRPIMPYMPIMDDKTKTKCTIYTILRLTDYAQIEYMIGEPLPRIYQGWDADNSTIWYNGNSLLQVTDAVGDLKSPLEELGFSPRIMMGFSKKTFQAEYESWMKRNGYESILEEDKKKAKWEKQAKKQAEQKRQNLPIPSFEESAVYAGCLSSARRYKNMQQIIDAAAELYKIFPEESITGYGIKSSDVAQIALSATTSIPVAGNVDRINSLIDRGWITVTRYRICGKLYAKLEKRLSH